MKYTTIILKRKSIIYDLDEGESCRYNKECLIDHCRKFFGNGHCLATDSDGLSKLGFTFFLYRLYIFILQKKQ